MTTTKLLALTGAVCSMLACKSKQEEPERAGPPVTAPASEGSAGRTAPTTPTPPLGAGNGATTPGVDAPYGTCDVTATGGISFESHNENLPSAVITDYWHTAEAKAATEKLRADAAARGEIYRMPEQPLAITCQDVPRGLHIRFAPTLSKLADIRPIPQDFPIYSKPADKPGVMRAEVTMREGGIAVTGGGLHVSRFEQGELAATFELQIETFDEPPKKSKLSGKFIYHCADHARCGMK